jgi:HSP20 family molecular chaperone IbpA
LNYEDGIKSPPIINGGKKMKQLLFVFCFFCSSVFSNEKLEFNWEKEEGEAAPNISPNQPAPPRVQPNHSQIQPQPNLQPQQPPFGNFPDSFGRVRELIEEMRSRFFDDAESIFNDPFFNEPLFNHNGPTTPFAKPFFQKQPNRSVPIPPSSSPFLRNNPNNSDMQIIEKQDLIIVELPLENGTTANNYDINVSGNILSITKTSKASEENHEQNTHRSYRSYSSTSFSRSLPAEVEPNFSRLQAGNKLILTFRKK